MKSEYFWSALSGGNFALSHESANLNNTAQEEQSTNQILLLHWFAWP